ncbi:IclR family transcriptional regulator [Desulfosarcina sp.]|uniref:IclR family transcriptional regulator n=1 Tax=Desulfosarcina sp. TaxID=2027861 RepID=UPI0029B6F980|nr:IclR family transcriptional regulator [Desulfosarcina sp.]MDX2451854.1 IclR family transcriptional regulator [Desulfosarcina sp.]MDX2489636.1 IclR family transcriptional regulator [Desulfosarcina sp.]
MPPKGEKYYFVASLAKGLRVLELLAANGDMSASRMAGHLDTSRAASHRFLTTLRDLGYVEKTEEGQFRLTFKVVELGMKKLDGFKIRHSVHPFLQEMALACGETVNFGHWDGTAIVHLDKINSTEVLRLDVGLGALAPAYCTGLGKAVLAFLPSHELEDYLESVEWVAMSPKTITTPEKLKTEIQKIRKRGYAIDNEELSLGLRCVGAPIFDHQGRSTYAMSVSGPTQRMTKKKINTIQAKLLPLCSRISRMIGAPEK